MILVLLCINLYFHFWSRVSGVTTLRRPRGIEYCGCDCVRFMLLLMSCSFACKYMNMNKIFFVRIPQSKFLQPASHSQKRAARSLNTALLSLFGLTGLFSGDHSRLGRVLPVLVGLCLLLYCRCALFMLTTATRLASKGTRVIHFSAKFLLPVTSLTISLRYYVCFIPGCPTFLFREPHEQFLKW